MVYLILMIVYNCTDIYDLINLSQIDKTTYDMFDDTFYMYWGRNLYSNKFWELAQKRTPIISKPLLSMKMELLRIQNFQNHLLKYDMKKWTNNDFYKYWEYLEGS